MAEPFIDGGYAEFFGRDRMTIVDPSSGEEIGSVPADGAAEELAPLLTSGHGKPLREARLEIRRLAHTLEHYVGLAKNIRGGYVPDLDRAASVGRSFKAGWRGPAGKALLRRHPRLARRRSSRPAAAYSRRSTR